MHPGSDRNSVEGTSVAAEQALAAGCPVEAERLWRSARDGGDPDAAFHLGELLIELNRPGEAEAILAEAVEGGDDDSLIPWGNALYDLGREAEAAQAYRRAAALGFHGGLYNLALMHRGVGEDERALELFREAVVLAEGDGDVHRSLAEVLANFGLHDEAECHFEIAARHGVSLALVDLGAMLWERGEMGRAEDAYRRALAAGEDSDVFVFLGSLLKDTDRVDEAEQVYRDGVKHAAPHVLVNLGNLLADLRGRPDEALECYGRAIEAGDEDAYNNRGVLLWELGNLEDAERALRQGAEIEDVLAMRNLASLLAELGRNEEARQILLRATELGSAEAAEDLAELRE